MLPRRWRLRWSAHPCASYAHAARGFAIRPLSSMVLKRRAHELAATCLLTHTHGFHDHPRRRVAHSQLDGLASLPDGIPPGHLHGARLRFALGRSIQRAPGVQIRPRLHTLLPAFSRDTGGVECGGPAPGPIPRPDRTRPHPELGKVPPPGAAFRSVAIPTLHPKYRYAKPRSLAVGVCAARSGGA